jgi:hypothetical protein
MKLLLQRYVCPPGTASHCRKNVKNSTGKSVLPFFDFVAAVRVYVCVEGKRPLRPLRPLHLPRSYEYCNATGLLYHPQHPQQQPLTQRSPPTHYALRTTHTYSCILLQAPCAAGVCIRHKTVPSSLVTLFIHKLALFLTAGYIYMI